MSNIGKTFTKSSIIFFVVGLANVEVIMMTFLFNDDKPLSAAVISR